MTAEIANPVTVEQAMKVCTDRIYDGVKVCDERYRLFMEADHAFDVAVAHAMVDEDGPAYLKKHKAVLATIAERKARDEADAAYRYADRLSRAVLAELSQWQSVNRSVTSMYGAVGVTER